MRNPYTLSKSRLRLLLLFVVFIFLTVSVSSQEIPEHGADFSGELTIAVWGEIDADPSRGDAYGFHEVLQQWNDMYPNVDLKYQLIGGTNVAERFTWINTNLLAGTMPDIVMMYFPGPDVYNAVDLLYVLCEIKKRTVLKKSEYQSQIEVATNA